MGKAILTSGFPSGFTTEFIQCVKDNCRQNCSFVFVSSDFTVHATTDHYARQFVELFNNNDIQFREVHVIDNRITKEIAAQFIKEADLIWITGGDTLKQIASIKEYNLISVLQNHQGLIIGMSAGSINMAKRVVLPKDIYDNIPTLSIYDGIGLVDINIEPHLDSASEEHLKDIEEACQYTTIYGLYDNSFITIIDGKMELYGQYVLFKKDKSI